jgi:glycosyltransferase involved in cell wall biosynthesis
MDDFRLQSHESSVQQLDPIPKPIRIVAMLETKSLSGPAKAVLEFANQASLLLPNTPAIELSFLTFRRSEDEDDFTREVRRRNLPLDIVRERHAFDLAVIPQIRQAIACRRPDILWTNAVKSHFLVRLARLHTQAKWIAFHHGYTRGNLKDCLYNSFDCWSLRRVERLVTVCSAFADSMANQSKLRGRIRVQHNCVPTPGEADGRTVAAVRHELGIEKEVPLLLSVGRLSSEKGHSDLLFALAGMRVNNPQLRFRSLLVGCGPELDRLQSICRRLGLCDLVAFVGYRADVALLYRISDIFVLPSRSDGSPLALLEAMSVGLPIVATSVGGITEIVTKNKDCFLVGKGDVGGLAEAIATLLVDRCVRDEMGKAARATSMRYAPEDYFRAVLAVFQEVISG